MKRGLIYLLFISLTGLLLSLTNEKADYRDDMLKVQETLSKEHISFTINYKVFSGHTGGKNVQEKTAEYYLWNNLFYSKSDEVDLLVNKGVSVSVDHEQKVITLNKYNANDRKKLHSEIMNYTADTVWKNIAEYTLVSSSETHKEWQIVYKRSVSGIGSSIVRIKIPEYYVTHVTLFYSESFNSIYGEAPDGVSLTEKPRLEITYDNYSKLSEVDKEKYFSIENIVTSYKNGKGILNPSYKNYTLANYYTMKP
jgi:hypothetical protein